MRLTDAVTVGMNVLWSHGRFCGFFRGCKWVHSAHLKVENEDQQKNQVISYVGWEWPVSFPRILGSLISDTQKFRCSHALKYQLTRSGQIEIIHVSGQIITLDNPEICEVVILNHLLVMSRGVAVLPPFMGESLYWLRFIIYLQILLYIYSVFFNHHESVQDLFHKQGDEILKSEFQ